MKCDYVQSKLSNFIDDELGAVTELAIEAHLGACDECRAYLAEIKQSQEALRSSLNLKASEGFDAAVMEAVRRPRTTFDALIDFMRPGWRQIAASTAAALVLVYLAVASSGVLSSLQELSKPSVPILPIKMQMVQDGLIHYNQPTQKENQERSDRNGGISKCCGDTCS